MPCTTLTDRQYRYPVESTMKRFLSWLSRPIIVLYVAAFFLTMQPGLTNARVPSRSAVLVNLGTGHVLYAQNPDLAIPPASLTKIMTIYIALDQIWQKKLSLNHRVTISKYAASVGGSSMHLRQGEKVSLVRLLTGTAVASGNDAATAVAEYTGKSVPAFVALMNRKAASLGLRGTTFKNPTGLPAPGQKTTAGNLATLCRAYLRNHPEAMRFHSTRFFLHRGKIMGNTNSLMGSSYGVNGLKTGWTIASGYNIIVTAQRDRTRLLAIVLGAKKKNQRDDAALRLLDAGFRHPESPKKARLLLGGKEASPKKASSAAAKVDRKSKAQAQKAKSAKRQPVAQKAGNSMKRAVRKKTAGKRDQAVQKKGKTKRKK